MKKAVIQSGGHQFIVSEGDEITVELIKNAAKTIDFQPLLVIDGEKTTIGKPLIESSKVATSVKEQSVKDEKVVSIRYKAKKRVKKIRGHRPVKTVLKVTKIL